MERASGFAENPAGDAAWAHCWIASCLDREGRPGSALDHLQTAVDLFERMASPPPTRFVKALTLYAQHAMDFGDVAAATAATERALALVPADDPGTRVFVIKALAQCRDAAGDHAQALADLAGARALAEAGGFHPYYRGLIAYEQAMQLMRLGRFEAARAVMDETMRLVVLEESLSNPERLAVLAGAHALSGQLHDRLGEVEAALRDFDAAIEIDERNPAGDRRGAVLRRKNRGSLLTDHSLRDGGIADLERARADFAAIQPTYDDTRALCDIALALARSRRGDFAAADELFDAACDHARREHSDMLPYWLAARGRMLLELRDEPHAAYELLSEAVALREVQRGAAAQFDALERSQYFAELDRYQDYSTAFRAAHAIGDDRAAVRFLEQARFRSLLDLLERRSVDALAAVGGDDRAVGQLAASAVSAHQARLALALERGRGDAQEAGRSERLAELERARLAAEGAQRAVERQRAAALSRDARLGVPADTDEILARLPPGASLLSYHVAEHGCWLIRLEGGSAEIMIRELKWPDGNAIEPAALRETVDRFVARRVDARGPTRGLTPEDEDGDPLELGERLFKALMPVDVWQRYGSDDTIYLTPQGGLQRLPFEALVVTRMPEPVHWLERGPAIAYVPSASVLLWCLQRRAAQLAAPRAPIDVVAFGDPVFELPRLVHSGREVVAIAAAFGEEVDEAPAAEQIGAWGRGGESPPRAVALVREQATLANLESLAPQARILHVATHQLVGRDDSGRPFNRLALSGEPLSLRGLLEGWQHRLDACELVVLSACDTHRSQVVARVQDREGVMALPWGLHFAGCPAVIASFWQVEDAGTAELMQRFCTRIAAGEVDMLRAFTAARRDYMRAGNGPGRWAPFLFLSAHGG